MHKLPIVLCFQMIKKNSTSNIDQTNEFCRNSLLQRDFLWQIQLENIIRLYIQSTLFTFYHTKFVLYNFLHFNETFFSRMFPGITLEGSHICGEPTK